MLETPAYSSAAADLAANDLNLIVSRVKVGLFEACTYLILLRFSTLGSLSLNLGEPPHVSGSQMLYNNPRQARRLILSIATAMCRTPGYCHVEEHLGSCQISWSKSAHLAECMAGHTRPSEACTVPNF